MSTVQVQKWVATVLTVVILGHLAEALVIFALISPADHPASASDSSSSPAWWVSSPRPAYALSTDETSSASGCSWDCSRLALVSTSATTGDWVPGALLKQEERFERRANLLSRSTTDDTGRYGGRAHA